MAKAPTDIRSLARSHTETALSVLAGIMRDNRAPHSARVAAAQALIDRGWGKAAQTIHQTITRIDADSLSDAELAAIATASSADDIETPADPKVLN